LSFSADRPAFPPTIGPYRITAVLGEGGMGVVYAAEQTAPIQRRIAVKVIRGGSGAADVVRRFEAERQALAVMEHPSIASVYDAGTTPDGMSYVAMEYVDGVPIGEYCDTRRLPTRQRLELFLHVCHAVQHAHQKGVIHRDLKPSNVLVAEPEGADGAPLPKVIDFGIAKAVNRRLSSETLVTELGLVMGTPGYMSPEQAEGTRVDVDTRTDVYSLGVMLYELLTSSLPADPGKIGLIPFIARLVSGNAVTELPSSRVSDRVSRVDVAARRRTEPGTLARELKGDLDAIVLKAVAPERERRYQTAQELAQDIDRYLRFEPITARAPSFGYRAAKFARRNPTSTALATAIALFLVATTVITTVQAGRVDRARNIADQRREQAEGLISFMVGDLRRKLEPIGRLEILDTVGMRALAYFAAVPSSELSERELLRRSQTLSQIGQVRMTQGDLDLAASAFRESEQLARALAARDTVSEWQKWLGEAHFWLGYTHYLRGELDEALGEFEPYLEISRRLVERDPTNPDWQLELGFAHTNIGSVREAQGNLTAALEYFRYTLEVKERLVLLDTSNMEWLLSLAHSRNTVGRAHERLGHLDSAEVHYRADVAIKERLVARDSANMMWRQFLVPARMYAARIDELRGRPSAAAAGYEAARRVAISLYAADSTNAEWARSVAVTSLSAGRTRIQLGQAADGLELLRAGRRILRALVGRDSTNADLRERLGVAELEIARAMAGSGDRRAAATSAAAAESLLGPLAANPNAEQRVRVDLAYVRLLSAELHAREGAAAAARAAWNSALEVLDTSMPGDELRALDARARALVGVGRANEARTLVAQLQQSGYREPAFTRFATELTTAGPRP
jgi:eukaryotic-like serine/threonine-protein kinase